ncbi:MAG TPA: thioredoxin domain-containing protein [Syntrophomonas sp.]|nr:thioredoxin domain-containing protein [Syntrophomonas sp.]
MDHKIKQSNRLIEQKSPYLLQHAYNPVDWFPWSEAAFTKAKQENKPVFLSIGYSTCHWCHVMAHESFEDQAVADLLNRHFVAVKVDREERPDIDYIYMMVCQTLTGHGGWPLTIIMDSEKRPFYAATYLPKESRGGMPGLLELLPRVARLWGEEKQALMQSGQQISQLIDMKPEKGEKQTVDLSLLSTAYHQFTRSFDNQWGGFGPPPKFPTPHNLLFLLRYYETMKEDHALQMTEKTLQSMYRGGMYDHVGFGFARYSTDRVWLVPHFEKMLYDNALLAMAYLECYRLTNHAFYATVSRDIFAYVLRDMTGDAGAFFSAEDADSEGEEGRFYLWSKDEVEQILGQKAERWAQTYDISAKGNFEGKNIPNLIHSANYYEARLGMEAERQLMLACRAQRPRPLKDDKVLTAWNGLMIAALAQGARILKEDRYWQAACRAVDFINSHLRRDDGRLWASYREGQAGHLAYAADYAYLIWGLLELYKTGRDENHLAMAQQFNQDMLRFFWDQEAGGLFFYGNDAETLLTRPKEGHDGAMPSANAVAAMNFLYLARLTGDEELEQKAGQTLDCFAAQIAAQPTAHSYWLLMVNEKFFPQGRIVLS